MIKRYRLGALRTLALAWIAVAVAQHAWATVPSPAAPAAPPPAAAATGVRLKVLFKLDPALSGGTYGGEHWVSPPTFTNAVQGGKKATVDAMVEGVDSRGAPVRIGPTWTAADPSMVVVSPVSPGATDRVQIAVTRSGETTLTIEALGVSRVLRITAESLAGGKGLQVKISQ